MNQRARTLLAVLAFVLVNLALAAVPADAGWDTDICGTDDPTVVKLCCVKCAFFCNCYFL